MAACDPLTGLANWRDLLNVFERETNRSRRTGRTIAFLLLDVDGLKKINAAYGHLVGSRALVGSQILGAQCRRIDIAGRFGGDEFGVILPETGIEGARQFSRRIRERIASDSQQPQLSVSVGIAVYPRDGETIEELANHTLYEMKQGGRACRSQHEAHLKDKPYATPWCSRKPTWTGSPVTKDFKSLKNNHWFESGEHHASPSLGALARTGSRV